jgi:hypothetical protein
MIESHKFHGLGAEVLMGMTSAMRSSSMSTSIYAEAGAMGTTGLLAMGATGLLAMDTMGLLAMGATGLLAMGAPGLLANETFKISLTFKTTACRSTKIVCSWSDERH